MIRYAENLYLTDKTREDLNRIKRKLRLGAGMAGMYVIMLSENPNDVFDIVESSMFKIRRFRHADHTVIGLAESRKKAYGIIESIVLAHYERTGKYTGLRDYYHGVKG